MVTLKLIPSGFLASLALIALGDQEWTLTGFFTIGAILIGIAFFKCLP